MAADGVSTLPQEVAIRIVRMKEEVQHAIANGTLHIDRDGVMRRIEFLPEMQRLIRNEIAWSHRHRREDEKKIAYFRARPEDDEQAHRIAGEIEADIGWYTERANLYKAELANLKEGA